MRPPKPPSERHDISFHICLTQAEKEQFSAQAKMRGIDLSVYFRMLARDDGAQLAATGKIRQNENGKWEALLMNEWKKMSL
jgi:hypothetical protein